METADPVPAKIPSEEPAAPVYEFTADQSKLIGALGTAMSDVGLFNLVAGVLLFFLGVVVIAGGIASPAGAAGGVNGSVLMLEGALALAIGMWTRTAGQHFRNVATTAGGDIPNLMVALGELRRIYGLQKILILVSLVLVGIVMLLAIVAMASR